MADHLSNPAPQGQDDTEHKPRAAGAELTQEQIQIIADRVYKMLLRDLKQDRERHRFNVTFKRG